MRWQRLIYIICLAFLEATPVALLLTLVTNTAWLPVFLVVMFGVLVNWSTSRWLPETQHKYILIGTAPLAAFWLVNSQINSGYGLFSGWLVTFTSLIDIQSPRFGLVYFVFLVSLYAFWRGLRVLNHDSISLQRLFVRTMILIIAIVGWGSFAGGLDVQNTGLATIKIISFFVVGLMTLALANASDDDNLQLHRIGWRDLLTFGGTIVAILVLGLFLTSLYGEETAQITQVLWQFVALIVAFVMIPFILILDFVITGLLNLFNQTELAELVSQNLPTEPPERFEIEQTSSMFPPWVSVTLQVLLSLLPIALILLAIFLTQRARLQHTTDEERESLWSWNNLVQDLQSVLNRRHPFPDKGGLRAALARLRGENPIHRIRRSYIQLLLASEKRECLRDVAHTPQEHQPAMQAVLPDSAASPSATLTNLYERARYNPDATTIADADEAEQVWQTIDDTTRSP